MQIFAKRFWGFDPIRWPIISFSRGANRDALIKMSRPGDCIVFIGTKTAPTSPEEQGRLLGLAEIGRLPIDSLEVLDRSEIPSHSFNNGQFKWPKALPMLRAWRVVDLPYVTDVLEKQLTYEATIRAVKLSESDQREILNLRTVEVEVLRSEIIEERRALNFALSGSGPTTGPTPASWSAVVERSIDRSAFTYAVRFGRRNLWKIGHATNLEDRLASINRHVPHEVLGETWSLAWRQPWATETEAYRMEQRVLSQLSDKRTEGERVLCTEAELQNAWGRAAAPQR